MRLKLKYTLEGEDMRNDLALPSVVSLIPGGKDISVNGEEGVVVVALQTSVFTGVDDLESIWVGDRHMVRSEPYEGPCRTGQLRATYGAGGGFKVAGETDSPYCLCIS